MFHFFTSTTDDILLIPSLLSVVAALVILTFRHSTQWATGFSLYLLSCLAVIIATSICAVLIHNKRNPNPRRHGRGIPPTSVYSGGFFASFPVGLLFAGEALYLAVIFTRDPTSHQFSSSSFTTSPILLCLLSTTAAVICLWSRQQAVSKHSKKSDDPNNATSTIFPFQEAVPLFEEWRVQQRSAFLAALFVSLIFPFLQLFPSQSSPLFTSWDHLLFNVHHIVCVFLFSLFFFSVLGVAARTIVRMTNGSFSLCEIIALSLVASLLIGPSLFHSLDSIFNFTSSLNTSPSSFETPSSEIAQAITILSVLGVFFFLFLLMTICFGRLRNHVSRSIYSLQDATPIHAPSEPSSNGDLDPNQHEQKSPNSQPFKHLPTPPFAPKWIQLSHLLSTLFLLSLLIYWLFYSIEPQSQMSPLLWLVNFVGIPQLLFQNSLTTRCLILISWVVTAPIAILLIHLIASPLQSTTSSLLTPRIRLLKVFIRKMYHIACVVAFLPVLVIFNDQLILLCGILVGIGLLVVLETIRVSGLPSRQLSCSINNFIERYLDSRDHRGLVVTHMYLLLGVGFPIVYETLLAHFHNRPIDLVASSQGLLAVGIGDSAAALVGVYLSGKGLAHPLTPPGLQRKTWEGVIAFFLSYLIASIGILQWTGRSPSIRRLIALTLTSAVSATFEATTEEVDNFLLPLFSLTTYRSLQAAAQVLLPSTLGQ